MAKPKTSRKQLFRAALAVAGMTAAEWAKEEGGVSAQWLSEVVNEKEVSPPLVAKIDAFVRLHMAGHKALAG